ncbi:MAG: hypothetical protein C4583_07715 [Anaerolineaceae bacterium]|nr:MAG: hypothetical protein C4583_07715 [Anaerolineaceae bacterium]
MPTELIYGAISFLLTLMVLSYLIGDNALFRFAIHVFVGVSAGYVAAVAIYQVIWPYLLIPLVTASMLERALLVVPLVFSALILMKISPRLSWLGGPAVGYLVGAGAAVAIGGAALGTILPQVNAAAEPFDVIGLIQRGGNPWQSVFNGVVMLVGTISTLAYFHFGASRKTDGSVKRNGLIEALAWLGKLFVALTLGVLFAGVYAAALSAFVERIQSLLSLFGF